MSDYNGWANYATWRINLEIIDDYVSSTAYDDTDTAQEWAKMDAYDMGQYLKDYADDVLTEYDENEDSLAISYARAFMDDVNWTEIGDHAVEQAKEALEYAAEEQ